MNCEMILSKIIWLQCTRPSSFRLEVKGVKHSMWRNAWLPSSNNDVLSSNGCKECILNGLLQASLCLQCNIPSIASLKLMVIGNWTLKKIGSLKMILERFWIFKVRCYSRNYEGNFYFF